MSRDPSLWLEDMLDAVTKIRGYTAGLRKDTFLADQRTVDAVVRNLEILGEAAKGVPSDIRKRWPEIEWRDIAGLRDVLSHQYFRVDLDIVWEIVQNEIGPLETALRQALEECQGDSW